MAGLRARELNMVILVKERRDVFLNLIVLPLRWRPLSVWALIKLIDVKH